MKNTRFEQRTSAKNYGELSAWLSLERGDNDEALARLRRALKEAREEVLTPRQRLMLHLRYEEGLRAAQIAERLGVQKSTVSRTLKRAEARLARFLKYVR